MNMWQGAFQLVDEGLDTYVVSTASDLISFISPIFSSMLIIWIAIWGYLMMLGKVSEPLQEGLFRIIRIGFIMTLGLTVGTYMDVIVNVLSNGPEEIATVITGSPADNSAVILDNLLNRVFSIGNDAWNKAGVMSGNFGLYIVALLIMGGGLAVTIGIAFLILVGKMAATVLLAIGPLFIIMLLFNSTQRFFESWLGMVINFGMVLVLGSAIGRLILDISNVFIDKMAASADFTEVWAAMLLLGFFGLSALFLKQVPNMAAALGGGVALATQGALSSTMNAMRPSTIRRQYRGIQRDARLAGSAATAPYRGAKKAYAAYQKRFGAGNTITGG
ncbi:type IV secretion system protein [uncultured Amphritea sp.]|jgi:type IV secretion system protein VirB6|uniref:type IV secretion system protein n=1 Tax=uncultured Amphritea sp. TaxID=981605 RepID=UPI00260BC60E|nr:type IV secretion system protein [uncultured Amphritea sp.]